MPIPPGYRFCPTDKELLEDYLKNKILNRRLPCDIIKEVNLYHYSPDDLAEMYKLEGEKEMYFFTPRSRRTQKGSRPNRTAGNGYWKASVGDKAINGQGRVVIGHKMVLNYYNGLHPRKEKSKWIMHEYKWKVVTGLPPAPTRNNNADDMRLDDWVLCKIYQKGDSNHMGGGGSRREIQMHLQENHEILNIPQEVSNIQQCSSITSIGLESENNQVEPFSSEPQTQLQLLENNYQYDHDILNNPDQQVSNIQDQQVANIQQSSSITSMGLESDNQVEPFSPEPQTQLQFLENNQYHDILNNPQQVSNSQQCSSMTSMGLESDNQVEPFSSEPQTQLQFLENNQYYHDILNNPQQVSNIQQCSSMTSMGLESDNQVEPFSSEPQTQLQFQYYHDILNNPQQVMSNIQQCSSMTSMELESEKNQVELFSSEPQMQLQFLENNQYHYILNNPQEVSNIQEVFITDQCSSMPSLGLESMNNQVEPFSSESSQMQLLENNYQYHGILNNPQEVFSTDPCSSIMTCMGESENQVDPFSSEPQTQLQLQENNYQYDHDILNNPQLQEVFINDQSSDQPQLQDISNNSDLESNQLSSLNNIIWEPEYDQFELVSSNQNYEFLYMDPL
ncbi:hypothetical protein HHK36_017295 [Tetracentron sinense]|uniref:NAC domain-containing protein n=1 Tax=Tetracentron sinense TaxID=13715 RepID=A0A835DCI2_TETSI|nr:hypothetical protein HHK36_017295 [Tetracentron sinense]